jgi:hypothetical protein
MKIGLSALLFALIAATLLVSAFVYSRIGPIYYWGLGAPISVILVAASVSEALNESRPSLHLLALDLVLDVVIGLVWAGVPLVLAISKLAGIIGPFGEYREGL